jgi:hypothetical protein
MPKNIRDGVKSSFSSSEDRSQEVATEQALKYMEALRPVLKDYSRAGARSGLLVLTLAVVFELLHRSIISEVRIGGVLIKDLSFLRIFLPPAIAYFFFDGVSNSCRYDRLAEAHSAAFSVWNRTAESLDLDSLVEPAVPLYWLTGGGLRDEQMDRFDKLQTAAAVAIGCGLLLGLCAFEIYAYVVLFRGPGISILAAVISLVPTVALTLLSLITFWVLT